MIFFFTMEHHGFCDDEFYFEEIPFGLWKGLIDGNGCVLPKLLSGGVLFSEQAPRLLLGGAMSRHILTI
jgi:hypothetical protein